MSPIPAGTLALIRLGLWIGCALAIAWAAYAIWTGYNELITAPVQTELKVSRAANEGFKAAAGKQNEGVKALAEGSKKRQERSAKAVEAAGKVEFEEAKRIGEAAPVGKTDYERAMNRIDRELGLR